MLSATVIFVLEELHWRMDEERDEVAEWGMIVGTTTKQAFVPGHLSRQLLGPGQ